MIGCLSHAPNQEPEPATQACALTGNQTGDFGLQDIAQPSEPHQSGLEHVFISLLDIPKFFDNSLPISFAHFFNFRNTA